MTPDKRDAYARFVVQQMRDIVTGLENGRIREFKAEHASSVEAGYDDGGMRWVKSGWHTLTIRWYDPSTRGRIEEEA